MSNQPSRRRAVVVGGGPVGCLCALSLAKTGWSVDVYEGRPDPRLPSSKAAMAQRSINLAMSSRGIAALASVDPALAERFMDTVIPMRGRMIHDAKGRTSSQVYDIGGQSNNSIDRALLNEGLLNEAAAWPGVRVHFEHKLATADFDRRSLAFRTPSGTELVDFDLCIGADGSYSNVRRQMMRFVRMDFQQEYIPHEYIELRMSAGVDANGAPAFKMEPNHLHIWPRHSFMLIALPNKDNTFTCTLFAPTSELDKLLPPFSFASRPREDAPSAAQAQRIADWFRAHFPDALELIGESVLVHDFWHNPRSALICVKASPYHYRDRVILLGDAAHAMTPFFGQGLNCGLEDVRILANIMAACGVDPSKPLSPGLGDQPTIPQGGGIPRAEPQSVSAAVGSDEDERLARALRMYTETRKDDLLAISQMAFDNYMEMRHHVTRPTYLLRKRVEDVLYWLGGSARSLSDLLPELSTRGFAYTGGSGPWAWLPLYTMVTFRPDISYFAARRKAERQSRILSLAGWGAVVAAAGWAAVVAQRRMGGFPQVSWSRP